MNNKDTLFIYLFIRTQMVGNESLHNESIPGMVCEACDACHAEMGILSSETDSQMVMF